MPVETKGEEVTVLRGDDVPYGYRASVLFHQIASAHKRQAKEGPDVESLLLMMGLDPSTEAGGQLVKLAIELDRCIIIVGDAPWELSRCDFPYCVWRIEKTFHSADQVNDFRNNLLNWIQKNLTPPDTN